MTDSTKFVQWLGDKVQAALSGAKASGDPLEAWRVLDEVQRALESGASMLFGAVISSHLPALQRELGPWVKQELTRLSAELEASVLGPLGYASQPPKSSAQGLLSRLGGLFTPGRTPPAQPTGVRDTNAALAFATRAGLALAHLLEHQDPAVRAVMAEALSQREAVPKLLEQLEREPDATVAHALVSQLNALSAEVPAPLVKAVAARFPELRPLLLVGRLSASPEAMSEVVADPSTRLDALLALAEPEPSGRPGASKRSPRHHAGAYASVRNRLIVEALADGDLAVLRAALKGVRTWKLLGAGARVLELARGGEPDALETLAALSAEDPALGFDLIVDNARRAPPVLVGLEALAQASKLSLAQMDALEALLPTLPAGPAADAIRRRLERKKPKLGTPDERLEALEAAIDERPDDVNAWLVWSDAVQGAGDPRGELVALAHAGKPVEAKLEAALPVLAPTLPNVLARPSSILQAVQLHMGLPREVRFTFRDEKGTQDELIAAVLGAPLGRFVTSVRLGLTSEVGDENDWAPSLEALARYGRNVRALLLGDFEYPDECEMSWVDWGDIGGVWALPRLERLRVRGGHGTIGAIASPTLKELVIETGGLSQTVINQLLSGSLAALTSLTLWTGDPDYGGDASLADVEGVLAWAPPGLTRLGIENCAFTHELVPLFARHPLTKRLSRLSFANGVLRAEDADALIAHAGAFAHLEQLDLSGNLLDEGSAERIVAALPRAVVASQREDYGDEDARYVAVGE